MGEPAKNFYLPILTGVWKLFQSADTGRVANLAFVSSGQVVCIHSAPWDLLLINFRLMWVVQSKVLVWSAAILRKIAEDTPGIAWNLCEILSLGIPGVLRSLPRAHGLENVEQRIAHTLIRLGDQIGKRQGHELFIDGPVSLEDLAGYTGTTLFTMSRVLKRWQRLGFLHRSRAGVVLRDLESIKKVADRLVPPRNLSRPAV